MIVQRVALNDFNMYLTFSSKASYSHLRMEQRATHFSVNFPPLFFFTFVRERILQCYKNSTRITSDPNCSFLQAIQERPSLVFDISQERSFTVQKVSYFITVYVLYEVNDLGLHCTHSSVNFTYSFTLDLTNDYIL